MRKLGGDFPDDGDGSRAKEPIRGQGEWAKVSARCNQVGVVVSSLRALGVQESLLRGDLRVGFAFRVYDGHINKGLGPEMIKCECEV